MSYCDKYGTERTPNREENGTKFFVYTQRCMRCGGSGIFYIHGTCYRCGGTGKEPKATELRLYTPDEFAKYKAATERREARKAAKAQAKIDAKRAEIAAKREAWEADNTDLVEGIRRHKSIDFVARLAESLESWGRLTDPQSQALRRVIRDADARAERATTAKHVGSIGERITVEVKIEKIIDITPYDAPYGVRLMNLMTDASGNAIVYRGGLRLAGEGETITLTATVKEHGEYRGFPQTFVSRPVVKAEQSQ